MNRVLQRLLVLAAATGGLLLVFFLVVRPAYLNWGSTPGERVRALPGDELVPNAVDGTTRAITIEARAEDVWPWLAQTGQDRGGFYSFDLLENLVGCEMPTVDRLRPEKQTWQIGDKLWMYPPGKAGGAGFATLRVLEPGRALGFGTRVVGTTLDEPENGSWSFILEPSGIRTSRLLMRGRGPARPSLLGTAFDRSIFEPIHYFMERRMLIGIKELAETGRRDRTGNNIQIAYWVIAFTLCVLAAIFVLTRDNWRRPLAAFILAAVVFQILTLAQPPLWIGIVLIIAAAAILRKPTPRIARTEVLGVSHA